MVSVTPNRDRLAITVLVSVGLAAGVAIALDLSPAATVTLFTTLLARDVIIGGTVVTIIAIVGLGSAILSWLLGAGKKLSMFVGGLGAAGAAAGTNALAGLAGISLTGLLAGGPAALFVSGAVALVSGHPVLIVLVGASAAFFVLDPLGSRGGFLEDLSFALKILVVTVLSFVSAKMLGPEILRFLTGSIAGLVIGVSDGQG